MPSPFNPSDLLVAEAQLLPLAEVLNLPPDRLLGVTAPALASLASLGVINVFDLAMSRAFNAALQIEDAADNPNNAMNRFGRPVSDLIKPGLPGTISMTDLRNESIAILADIDDAATIESAFGVRTVRDLSVYPPFRAAREILNRVFFPEQLETFDPESPADLIPKSGEFPTERVQYSTLVLDQILRPANAPPLIDLGSPDFKPVDITPVIDAGFGFTTLGLGMLLTFNQSWFMQGVTLGHLLHSMALAAGESTRIAVVDWSRKVNAGQTEQLGETEDLSNDLTRNRSISEVTEAVARESQSGFSHTESSSTTKQAGASAGISIGPFGGGASASISKTKTSADSYATSAGSREIGASMLQNVSDRTHQNAHSARTRRASVVREVSQTEHESVSTRVITNYNHMHALTVQYYEVVQVYRTETSLSRCDRVVFVPFRFVDFSNADLLRRFRGALIDAALTEEIRDALVNFDTLELVPERRAVFPGVGGSISEVLAGTRVLTRRVALARIRPEAAGTGTGGTRPGGPIEPPEPPEAPPTPPRPPRPPVIDDVADNLWEHAASRLSAFIKSPVIRRGSQSLFVPSDVRLEEGAVQTTVRTIRLVFILRDGTRVTDLSSSIAFSEVDRISLQGSDPAADVAATGVLSLSRNGILFPLELPTVTVPKGATETRLIDVRAAGADVNLVQHLNDNRLHYSQEIFRSLDAAVFAGLLSPFSVTINGQSVPLVQVAEPIPLRIVGNALAFKINTDPINDAEWRAFMASRGLTIGQAKVDIVPISSGGVFAEAVLGRFNCAEKLDLTRFFNWQDSPIPIQPTEIAAIQTGTRKSEENLTPGQFSSPLVSIQQPPALPDPTGLAAAFTAIQNGNIFRDMSGLADTIKLATETAKLSAAGATAVGNQATDSLKAALTADTERKKIAADLEKAKLGKSLQDKSITEAGAVVNAEEAAKKKAADAAKAASGSTGGKSGTGSTSGTGGSSTTGGGAKSNAGSPPSVIAAPTSTGNSALDRIIGNDAALRSFIGLSPDSPVPTPTVTPEGVPLQELDFFGATSLGIKASETAEAQPLFGAELEEVISRGIFLPDSTAVRSLLLGDRQALKNGFDSVLKTLSLAPVGSVRTLNLIAHASSAVQLDFNSEIVYTENSDFVEHVGAVLSGRPFLNVAVQSLVKLLAAQEIEVDGVAVKINDVRKAFPVDGQVHVFNMSNPLIEDFVQLLANLFQVRTTAFVDRPVRVQATVVTQTEDEELVLSKKIDVGFPGEPGRQQVDFFTNLLGQDPARTGLFTAFPRRG
ncbi:MAG: hypothetical protein ACKVW3_14445 [Phycisphaerales bacterium]